jgi:O-antigen/teichoic acid export membrane protein
MKVHRLLTHKVVRAGSWYTLTEIFVKGISFLTIPIFTRLLSTSDYGLVSLFTTWVSILTIIVTFDLKNSIAIAKYDFNEKYDEFASSILFLSILLFSMFFLVFIFNIDFFINITGFQIEVLLLLIIVSYFTFVKNFTTVKLRFEYKYKTVSLVQIVSAVLGVILSLFLIVHVFNDQRYLGKIIGSSVFTILIGTTFSIYIFVKGKKLINLDYWKYALVFSAPLMFHSLSGIINAQFDRIIINNILGSALTGIYSFAYNVGIIMNVFKVALDNAWTPWAFEKFKDKKFDLVRTRAFSYSNLFVFLYAVILLVSPELIKIMAAKPYWAGLSIMPWIFMAYFFNFLTSFEVKVERFYKRTGLISVGTVLSASINIVLNLIFIPKYGYIAAAITTTVSYFLLFVFHYIITTKVIKVNVYGLNFYVKSCTHVLLITLFYVLFQDIVIIRMVGIGFLAIFFYKSIKEVLNNMKT